MWRRGEGDISISCCSMFLTLSCFFGNKPKSVFWKKIKSEFAKIRWSGFTADLSLRQFLIFSKNLNIFKEFCCFMWRFKTGLEVEYILYFSKDHYWRQKTKTNDPRFWLVVKIYHNFWKWFLINFFSVGIHKLLKCVWMGRKRVA